MKIHRFIVENQNFNTGSFDITDKELVNQIKNVLRLKVGEELILCDGNFTDAHYKIISFKKDFIEGEIFKIEPARNATHNVAGGENKNQTNVEAVLYCAVLKKENFEWVVQKATELGISEIVPVITKKTIKFNLNFDRLNKIIKEASEQSGRGDLPILHEVMKFEDAVNYASKNDINVFYEIGENLLDPKLLKNNLKVGVFIGPEGGWDSEEILIARENKFKVVGLGNFTLRGETAAIVGIFNVLKA